MKNKAFSLIEIIVAVAIIAILSSIVGIKVKDNISRAKNLKVEVSLNNIRTAIQMYELDTNEEKIFPEEKVTKNLEKLKVYLDKNFEKILKTGEMEVGNSRNDKNGELRRGGKVKFTFKKPVSNEDDIKDEYIWIVPAEGTGAYDSKGKKWIEY